MNQDILDIIADGIGDRMDIDTGSSHWAEGALAALQAAGYSVVPSRAIESLAIAYHAYMVDLTEDDATGIVIWGEMLLKAQAETGVKMTDEAVTREVIGYAMQRARAAHEARA